MCRRCCIEVASASDSVFVVNRKKYCKTAAKIAASCSSDNTCFAVSADAAVCKDFEIVMEGDLDAGRLIDRNLQMMVY